MKQGINKILVILVLLAVIVVVPIFYWLIKDNSFSISEEEKTGLTPARILSIRNIGEWEFLTINDEEIADTIRHGFFGDDELVRIYYGTLRLGIDMRELSEGWLRKEKDTLIATLPPVKLLDENFIDEARTRPFFESGEWSQEDREKLYWKAYRSMRKRCMTEQNIRSAEQNASLQFYNVLRSMGFENVQVRFKDKNNP